MTDFTELSLEERQAIQRSLAADREENIENWRSYKKNYPDVANAGATFAQNIIDTEIKMEFNAATIRKLEEKAAAKPSRPLLPRMRGH